MSKRHVYVVSPFSIRRMSVEAAEVRTNSSKFDTLGSAVLEYLALNSDYDLNEEIIAQFILEFLTSPLPNNELFRQHFGKEQPSDTDIVNAVQQYVHNLQYKRSLTEGDPRSVHDADPAPASPWCGKIWYNPAKDFYTTTLGIRKIRKDTFVVYWSPNNTKAYYPIEEWSSNFVLVDSSYFPPLDEELQFTLGGEDTHLVQIRDIYTYAGQLWARYSYVDFPTQMHKMELRLEKFIEDLDARVRERKTCGTSSVNVVSDQYNTGGSQPSTPSVHSGDSQSDTPAPNSEWNLKDDGTPVTVISNSMGYTIVHSETEEPPVRSIPTDLFLRLYTPKTSA